jgi:hypothetical protein
MMNSVISALDRQQLHAQLDQILDAAPHHIKQAAEAEAHVREKMRELAHDVFQHWADHAHKSDGAPLCEKCGRALRHRGCPSVVLETTLGTIDIKRPRRCCDACHLNLYPHDAALRFGDHGVSWPLARLVTRYASGNTFEESRSLLAEDYGVSLSKETIERIVQHAGEVLLRQDDARRTAFFALSPQEQQTKLAQIGGAQPQLVALSLDGTMLHAEGEFREIRVGRVMTYDAEGERLGEKSFARFLPVEQIGQQLFLQACELGYRHALQRVFLGDGAHWIWDLADMLFPEAVKILDWYHLDEKVHETAQAVWPDEQEKAQSWASEITTHLWEGRTGHAKAAVLATQQTLKSPLKREALRTLHVYLTNNTERMNYPSYREAGYPIGSGMIESHCKRVVQQRCKSSGMRNWRTRNAESVLRFRTARIDGNFDQEWESHLKLAA